MAEYTVAQADNILFRVKGDNTLYRGFVLDVKNKLVKISTINESIQLPIESMAKRASRIFEGNYWVIPRNEIGLPSIKIMQYPTYGQVKTSKNQK